MSVRTTTTVRAHGRHSDETVWQYTRIVRVEFAQVNATFRRNPLWTVPQLARWALLGYDHANGCHLLATNADTVNLLSFARSVASANDAVFDEPTVCEYCALPVPIGTRYCPDTGCWLLDGGRETAWWVA